MANNINNSPRGAHVAPGIYQREIDLSYATKSLGITKLGLVGETLMGPAFQRMPIANWREYQTMFGGTSTELFRGSKYPKYELPYIAKEYLSESDNLQVVRVLGLSGVNAGPAWIVNAYKSETEEGDKYTEATPMVVAVIRSRGEHKKAAWIGPAKPEEGICEDQYEYDGIEYYAQEVAIVPSSSLTASDDCNPGFSKKDGEFKINVNNYGTFTFRVKIGEDEDKKPIYKFYPVTLNPADKNYIINVLGTDPEVGDCEIFVEELYDVALRHLIETGEIDTLGKDTDGSDSNGVVLELPEFKPVRFIPTHKDVKDILTFDEALLKRRNVGERYLYSAEFSVDAPAYQKPQPLKVHIYDDSGNSGSSEDVKGEKNWYVAEGEAGHIYTVEAHTMADGTRKYWYVERTDKAEVLKNMEDETSYRKDYGPDTLNPIFEELVKVNADDVFYAFDGTDVTPITLDMNNYKEPYRYASTPWVVSEIKGSAEHVELTKLFRFHMISDGNSSNALCKVSIMNIDPDNGTFDVVVRAFNDTDSSPMVLERYTQCDLVPGSKRYLGLLIGTVDEKYEIKSNYITVEINESDKTAASVPAGFLGYPLRSYENGLAIGGPEDIKLQKPEFQYNLSIDEDIKPMKQYFGVSDRVGIDTDILSYKGVEAYNGLPDGLSPCFHLDSRIFSGTPDKDGVITENNIHQVVTVDGITGYSWATVGKGNMTAAGIEPRIGKESDMYDTIYEDKRYRKFTMAFYGGWDGWDYYRTSRSIGDEYQYSTYKGNVNFTSGYGSSLDVLQDAEERGLNSGSRALTSDFYAFLAGVRQFANSKESDINIIATPGMDYVNNNALVGEVIEMVEEERQDAVYIVTTPDKPFGASDSEFDMYTPNDAVWNLEDADIDSNYVASYYPWVKHLDKENNQYIYLPVTKDVVRNMAYTDNVAAPWFASAGWNRGTINGIRPKKSLKLAEQDTLYAGRLNYVNTFAQEGMRIWGDKNMQVKESVMNRLSKRRLLLRIRQLCNTAAIGLLFDPNDNTTKKSFISAITPVMDGILSKRGISDWRLEIDDSVEARDRLELPAKIFLKPIGALEYITMDFIITPQSTNWDTL